MEKNHCWVLSKTHVPVDSPVTILDGKFASFPVCLREKPNKTNQQNHSIAGCIPAPVACFRTVSVVTHAKMLPHWLLWLPQCQRARAKGEVPSLSLFPLAWLPQGIHREEVCFFRLWRWIRREECDSFNLTEKEQNETPTHWGNCFPLRGWWGPKSCYLQRALLGVTQSSHWRGFHPKPQAKQWEMSIKETIFHSAKKKKMTWLYKNKLRHHDNKWSVARPDVKRPSAMAGILALYICLNTAALSSTPP